MHIIIQSTMHEIIHQQHLYYFTRASSAFTAITSSHLQTKLLHEAALSNHWVSVTPHLTVTDLYKWIQCNIKTSQNFISVWKSATITSLNKLITSFSYDIKPYLMICDLHMHFSHFIILLTSHWHINMKKHNINFSYNVLTPS